MKNFKQYNEEVHQPNVDNTTTPPGVKDTKLEMDVFDIIIKKYQDRLDEITAFDVFTPFTDEIKKFRNDYPYVKDEEPHKTKWWDFVKLWHKKLTKLSETDPDGYKIFSDDYEAKRKRELQHISKKEYKPITNDPGLNVEDIEKVQEELEEELITVLDKFKNKYPDILPGNHKNILEWMANYIK